MFQVNAALVGLFSILILGSFIQTSEAKLWELIIEVQLEKSAIYSGESLVVSGKVVDHAYDPIRGGEVLVRIGADTIKVFTNPAGEFKAVFSDFKRTPGSYIVNIAASWYEMKGMTTTEIQVKGEISKVSALQEKLDNELAIKYLSSDESDFEKDPIGQMLFRYYHNLLNQLVLEHKEALKPNVDQIHIEQQRIIAENLKNQRIEEYQPKAGTFDGARYSYYINSLNPEIRDLVSSQLNFTKNNFEQAQIIRDQILANGGTYEEARQAYLGLISIPREALEQFNQKHIEDSDSE